MSASRHIHVSAQNTRYYRSQRLPRRADVCGDSFLVRSRLCSEVLSILNPGAPNIRVDWHRPSYKRDRILNYTIARLDDLTEGHLEKPKEIFAFALFAGVVLPVAAESAPVVPFKYAGPGVTIPVADGCGFNRYRDSRGICRRKYEFTRHRGKPQLYGACGGMNSHRVCDLYGQCWMVCD
jgi:hypothetical protein